MTRSDIKSESREDSITAFNNKRGNAFNNKTRQSYMAQPNVKEFNKTFYKKAITGRPCKFDSVEYLHGEILSFLELCDKTSTIPTVTALCTWLHCSRDLLYRHANNSNSPFHDTLKNYIDLCHTSLENGAVDGKVNSVVYIFMGKNYFNLEDNKNITVSASSDTTITNSAETMDAIQKQLSEENTINANYNES